MEKQLEIECTHCGSDSLLLREAVYEGFAKAGEKLKCSSCGHMFESEEDVPFKVKAKVEIFDETDKSPRMEVFSEDEKGVLCRHCRHYVINPFTQWCHRHRKEVQATDSCSDFAAQEGVEKGEDETAI